LLALYKVGCSVKVISYYSGSSYLPEVEEEEEELPDYLNQPI
jgi:hypothetical protein